MSGASSKTVEWFSLLEPARRPENTSRRADDPRLWEAIEYWDGNPDALKPGRAIIVGFPTDEGVRRNGGRSGAADAPSEIRGHLGKLTTTSGERGTDLATTPPLDAGDVRMSGSLEDGQSALGTVVGEILKRRGIPVVIGGGHETAYGHFLGYVLADIPVAIVNLDAHLDVRPLSNGLGHSGSPFRQAIEHLEKPLPKGNYVCLGAQPHAVAKAHVHYVCESGGEVVWAKDLPGWLPGQLKTRVEKLGLAGTKVYVSLDADVVSQGDVPGVSAPNAAGLPSGELLTAAWQAGTLPAVASFDLVEIIPRFDRDGRSARWAALTIWHFLHGLAARPVASRLSST
jgi:formiminoglutamase